MRYRIKKHSINSWLRTVLLLHCLLGVCCVQLPEATVILLNEDGSQSTVQSTSDSALVRQKEHIGQNVTGNRSDILAGITRPIDECRKATQRFPIECKAIRESCDQQGAGIIDYLELYYCSGSNWHPLIFVFMIGWLGMLFIWLGISASDYFTPNISTLTQLLHIPESLAGITLIAFGNGAPDLLSTFNAVRTGSGAMAIGELVGGAAFIVSVVVGATTLVEPSYRVNPISFLRELCFFVIALGMILSIILTQRLTRTLALCMVELYIVYIITVMLTTYYEERRKQHARIVRRARYRYHGMGRSVEGIRLRSSRDGLSSELERNEDENIFGENSALLDSDYDDSDNISINSGSDVNIEEILSLHDDDNGGGGGGHDVSGNPSTEYVLEDYFMKHRRSLLTAVEFTDFLEAINAYRRNGRGTRRLKSCASLPQFSAQNQEQLFSHDEACQQPESMSYEAEATPQQEINRFQWPTYADTEVAQPDYISGETEDRVGQTAAHKAVPKTNSSSIQALRLPQPHSELLSHPRLDTLQGPEHADQEHPLSASGSSTSPYIPTIHIQPPTPMQPLSELPSHGSMDSPFSESDMLLAHPLLSPQPIQEAVPFGIIFLCERHPRAMAMLRLCIPTLRYWRENAPAIRKLTIALSAFPVFVLTLTVPVVSPPLPKHDNTKETALPSDEAGPKIIVSHDFSDPGPQGNRGAGNINSSHNNDSNNTFMNVDRPHVSNLRRASAAVIHPVTPRNNINRRPISSSLPVQSSRRRSSDASDISVEQGSSVMDMVIQRLNTPNSPQDRTGPAFPGQTLNPHARCHNAASGAQSPNTPEAANVHTYDLARPGNLGQSTPHQISPTNSLSMASEPSFNTSVSFDPITAMIDPANMEWAQEILSYIRTALSSMLLCSIIGQAFTSVSGHLVLVVGSGSLLFKYMMGILLSESILDQFFPCLFGFMCGISWVYLISGEIVAITQAMGLIMSVSEEILGLVVVGLGNSVGDLVTNLTLTRMGFPMMAISACFGGPMLNILLGIGMAACGALSSNGSGNGEFPIHITSPSIFISVSCLFINVVLILVTVPLQRYTMSRKIGIVAIVVYCVGMSANIYLES